MNVSLTQLATDASFFTTWKWPLLLSGGALGILAFFWSSSASAQTSTDNTGGAAAGPVPPTPDNSGYNVPPAGVPPAGAPMLPTVPTLPGSLAPTADQMGNETDFWNALTPANPPPSGYINFPSGAQAAAAAFSGGNTRVDSNGNAYVLWGGLIYMIAGPDSSGNYTADQIQ